MEQSIKPGNCGLPKLVDYGEDSTDSSLCSSPAPDEPRLEVKDNNNHIRLNNGPVDFIATVVESTEVVTVEENKSSNAEMQLDIAVPTGISAVVPEPAVTDGTSMDEVNMSKEDAEHQSESNHLEQDKSNANHLEQDQSNANHLEHDQSNANHLEKDQSNANHLKQDQSKPNHLEQVPSKPNRQNYRDRKDSTSSSSSSSGESDVEFSSSSDSDSDSDSETPENPGEKTTTQPQVKKKGPKPVPHVKGELSLEDLEPIVDLQISVPENKVELIGKVVNIVGCLVTVESLEKKPALDLHTVLFTDEGRKAIGHIFEVFGRTSQPFYCVRFNSPEHAKERGIVPGTLVYAAPGTEHTRYVFLAQLERLRGTDASWKDDHEAPNDFQDYSDDDMERVARNKNRKPRSKKNPPVNRSVPPEAKEVQEATEGNRMARKRNFGYNNNNFGCPPNVNRFVPPVGFNAPNRFGAPGPFRPNFAQPCFRPVVPEFSSPPEFYGAPRYGPADPYGNSRFPPPPPNPFAVGGAAVTYRPPYEQCGPSWINNYDYQSHQQPNLGYWHPQPQYAYDYQAAWAAYQYSTNYQYQLFPEAQQAPPPPPPQSVIIGAPTKIASPAVKPAVI